MPKNNKTKAAQAAAKEARQPVPETTHGILDIFEAGLKKKKNIIIGAAIAVLAIAALWGVWEHIEHQKYQKQWGNLFMAELAFINSEDRSLKPLEVFAAQNAKTDAGVYAAFTLGNAYYQLRDYIKAETYFKQAMAHGNKNMAPLAEVSLIAAQVAAADYKGAIAQADSFAAKYPAHFAMAQIKHYRAMAQELAGYVIARQSYQEIERDYPNTYYAAFARQRLAEMK